ncbi:unnamed protein product [Didymodactylos carnosus]|uniref:Uncharacterized protein n=1 Tax=Didymodactylos carnosus TaxID=1234261 RepID=A0A814FGB3_9BILA|nr:unnamed protein product [Didymodactylos carnosus]CAF0980958.1 unnamed protein product [Didymodactylos carnosus]CAF3696367.1 unnamed protein product [Didymodactylos carnosus]CAF3753527.1 unnamed protein product [Didymodactylos carnosus]
MIIAKRPDGKPVQIENVWVDLTMLFENEQQTSIEVKDLYTRGNRTKLCWGFTHINGLFKNNLIMNVTTQQIMDYEVSSKAKDYNRIYLVLDSLSDSTVGVNVFEFYAINQGLQADVTIERLLKYYTAYEYTPIKGMPTLTSNEERKVSVQSRGFNDDQGQQRTKQVIEQVMTMMSKNKVVNIV